MEEFVKRILEIDQQAKAMTVDMDELRRQADDALKETLDAIQKEIKQDTQQQIEAFKEKELQQSAEKLKKKTSEYQSILQSFDEQYEKNKDFWVDKLVKNAIE
mgnify:CR=1 FL=1